MNNNVIINCEKGWQHLYQPIIDEIVEFDNKQNHLINKIGIKQINSIFGELSFLFHNSFNVTPHLKTMLADATAKSRRTCEYCGTQKDVGTTQTHGTKVCCYSCWNKHIRDEFNKSIWKIIK